SVVHVLAVRSATISIHGQGGIATLGPKTHPFSKSPPATAMDQYHGWKRGCPDLRSSVVRKDARRFPMKRDRFVVKLSHDSLLSSPRRLRNTLECFQRPELCQVFIRPHRGRG